MCASISAEKSIEIKLVGSCHRRKLTVEGSIKGLELTEFFLVLSSTGLACRCCGLAWINGDQLGVSFMRQISKSKTKVSL